MSANELLIISGRMVIDERFRRNILDPNSRERILQQFDLTPEELRAVIAIEARTSEDFVAEMEKIFQKSQGEQSLPPAAKK